MDKPVPYNGSGSYVFVCYSHENEAVVYPEIRRLQQLDLNIWYDEGISAGANWRAEIGDRVEHADCVLFFSRRVQSPLTTATGKSTMPWIRVKECCLFTWRRPISPRTSELD